MSSWSALKYHFICFMKLTSKSCCAHECGKFEFRVSNFRLCSLVHGRISTRIKMRKIELSRARILYETCDFSFVTHRKKERTWIKMQSKESWSDLFCNSEHLFYALCRFSPNFRRKTKSFFFSHFPKSVNRMYVIVTNSHSLRQTRTDRQFMWLFWVLSLNRK